MRYWAWQYEVQCAAAAAGGAPYVVPLPFFMQPEQQPDQPLPSPPHHQSPPPSPPAAGGEGGGATDIDLEILESWNVIFMGRLFACAMIDMREVSVLLSHFIALHSILHNMFLYTLRAMYVSTVWGWVFILCFALFCVVH
ncbi:hypothetical protein L1987_24035 [Smallanthus sonchifolius]|uniref:Uncharacterized protein n=1 Tax=Smallanthus sonchifolius TaxID=185202 RepID=A0ACB9ILZ1_9ASTR|nr:hypothetical protein L1987_24035 [Smallanthus sonchifolius]